MTWRILLVLAALSCGGAQTADPSDTNIEGSCQKVADHMAHLAATDPRRVVTVVGPSRREDYYRECRTIPWSAARRHCLLNSPRKEDTLQCPPH
jgi:hypothetical protein